MDRELLLSVEEELVAEYLENHPESTEREARLAVAGQIFEVAQQRISERADWLYELSKDQ